MGRRVSRKVLAGVGVGVVVAAALVGFAVLRGPSGDSLPIIPKGDAETLLAPDDPSGSPHFQLSSDFDPAVNEKKAVPDGMDSDPDGVLEVTSASMVPAGGPLALVWTIVAGDASVECVNCALLDVRVKRIIASAIEAGVTDGVTRINGVDPARTLAGDYSGNGWQVEFVVGDSARAQQTGETISAWALAHSSEIHVLSVLWQNLLYGSDECGRNLEGTPPVEAYPTAVPEDAASRADAGMDRVIIASPSYVPRFEDRDGAQFLSGWKATSC